MYDVYEEMMEYYRADIDADEVSASMVQIFRFCRKFLMDFTESMQPNWFEISFDSNNEQIVIEKCSKSMSVEQGDFGDPINYNYYNNVVLTISATAEEYINVLTDYIMKEQEWKEFCGDVYNYITFKKTQG